MVAEVNSVITTIGSNIVLKFTVGNDAKPPIDEEGIVVTFNGVTLQSGDHVSLLMDGNVLLIRISSLMPADKGVYAVTVETTAGSNTAKTWLTFYGEGMNCANV